MKRISKITIKEYFGGKFSREQLGKLVTKEYWSKFFTKRYWQRRRIKSKLRHREQRRIREAKRAVRQEKFRSSRFGHVMQEICKWMNRFSLLMHVLLATVLNFLIEAISRHSVKAAWTYMVTSPWTFVFNMYMIFATLLIVYIFRRRLFTRIIISTVWLILGIVNGYMLSVRVTPFNAQDLKVIDDALSMIDKYFTGIQGILIISACLLVIAFLVFLWNRGGIYEGKMHRVLAVILSVVGLAAIVPYTDYAIDKRLVSDYFGNIAFAYEDYGFPYCFAASLFNTGIDEPGVYSKETMEVINDQDILKQVSTSREEMPNIILIQLESFFDVDEVEYFTSSEDPIPTFHSLMKNYTSGYFKVPSIGAGTANTEFEVLTGMSLRYFGPGEYPYKTIMKYQEAESAATALREFGYGTHALHNNGGNFYSRADVFNKMGFDDYTSKEFMNILNYTENGWAVDAVLTQHILNALDTTKQQDFVFGITVEGHGDYEEKIENPRITVSGDMDEKTANSWEYIVNHLYATDTFIDTLIKELEKRGEPTVLILYGDHLPTMGLEAKDLKNRYLYNTNYVMWDNIGLERESKNLTSYQLTSYVFERLGIQSGTVFNYHQNRCKTKNYLADLELLQYDILYGEQYIYGQKKYETNRENEFRMGVKDVTLTDIQMNPDSSYSIYGTNLTPYSKIYLNGEQQKTQFLNNTRVELRESQLADGDTIIVNQMGSGNRIFRSSETYIYTGGTLVKEADYIPPTE